MLSRNEKVEYWFKEWIEPIVIAAILALFIRAFFVQAFKIPTGSMRMTLLEGDRILVSKIGYKFKEPKRGDVVVFQYPGISFFQLREFASPEQLVSLCTEISESVDVDHVSFEGYPLPYVLTKLNALFNSDIPFVLYNDAMTLEDLPKEGQKLIAKFEKRYGVPFSQLSASNIVEMNQNSFGKRLKRIILETKFPDLCPESEYPKDRKRDFIKRLIAVGGEEVEIKNHDIYINGALVTDNQVIRENRYYNIKEWEFGRTGIKITVPDNSLFVLGDNSKSSSDSRNWGFVDREDLIGEAFFIYWPPKRWKLIK